MTLSKVNFNSLNVTPSASKALKFNSSNNGLETGDVGGSLVLLQTITASSDSTITFSSNIDSTYKEYIFKYINVHPSNDGKHLQVAFRDGGSNYDATMTTNYFRTHHDESDSEAYVAYRTDSDLAQSTSPQRLGIFVGSDNDQCCSGILHLFDPSNTYRTKHFIARTSNTYYTDYHQDEFIAGYINVTAAIDGVQFSASSNTIESGTFKMYGVS
jgi:hypothetical protein